MQRPYQIFVPEWVPLENKGEEAIIRGMADVLFPDGDAEFHILDMKARAYRYHDGLHVHRGDAFYSPWRSREFGLGWDREKLTSSACSLMRNGLNRLTPNWVRIPQGPLQRSAAAMRRLAQGFVPADADLAQSLRRLLDCDYLIAGHDGALNEYDCHVIDAMRHLGMAFSIFGSTMKPNARSPAIIDVFRQTLGHAEFIYCRDEIAARWARTHFAGLDIRLAPDPAFGMRSAPAARVTELLQAEQLTAFFQQPVIMATPAEPAPIARHSFTEAHTPDAKREAHRRLLTDLLRHITTTTNANVLFLPHSIGPTPDLDDRTIARDLIARAGLPADRVRLLETEYGARDLKALIGSAAMLVAERIHSIIGAIGVQTPFLCLGSHTDARVSGIVGTMLESPDLIYHLNEPVLPELCARFDTVWQQRPALRERLRRLSARLEAELATASAQIRPAIDRACASGKRPPS